MRLTRLVGSFVCCERHVHVSSVGGARHCTMTCEQTRYKNLSQVTETSANQTADYLSCTDTVRPDRGAAAPAARRRTALCTNCLKEIRNKTLLLLFFIAGIKQGHDESDSSGKTRSFSSQCPRVSFSAVNKRWELE